MKAFLVKCELSGDPECKNRIEAKYCVYDSRETTINICTKGESSRKLITDDLEKVTLGCKYATKLWLV